MNLYPYYWRVKTRLPERYGQFCKVLSRGKMNTCLVEFPDGYQVSTSRNYIRKHNVRVAIRDQAQKVFDRTVIGGRFDEKGTWLFAVPVVCVVARE